MKIFVIGNQDFVLGFSLVGVDGQVAHDRSGLEQILQTAMANPKIGLILVSSDVAVHARERVDALKINSVSPLVVEVPGEGDDTSYPSLLDFVQRAVGVRLGGL